MNCERARESFPELLDPRLGTERAAPPGPDLEAARAHLANCPDCQRDFAALSRTLTALDTLPVPPPTPGLRRDFYAMLEEEKHSAASARSTAERQLRQRRRTLWRWILAPAGCAALVAAGFFAGLRFRPAPAATPPPATVAADESTHRELQELRGKVERLETMNQLVAATLQQQQQRPATDRLRDILTSAAVAKPSDQVITELITSLALDPSVNVRLRALEALYPHAQREIVRAGVLASLPRESDPLVQVAMIDFLAAARDREARSTLESMSLNEAADQTVRTAARRALAQL